jgi:DNA-binding MurR/RpiR family transcriptional regulator
MIESFPDDLLSSLSAGELDFLCFAELHPDLIISSTLDQAAATSFTSSAIIERACKKLMLSGYPELRYRISKGMRSVKSPIPDEEPSFDPNQVLDELVEAAKVTMDGLDAKLLAQVASTISDAGMVGIFGRGLSEFPAKYLSEYLDKIDRPCRRYLDPPFAYRDAASFGMDDVFVIFSSGGRTIPVVKAATIARKSGVTLISICSNETSPLSKLADIRLLAPSNPLRIEGIDLNSRFTSFLIVDALIDTILESQEERGSASS